MNPACKCPLCESVSIDLILERKQVPVHQNLIMADRESAVRVKRGDLKLYACQNCSFVFNGSFDPAKLSYGEGYENCQSFSRIYEEYLNRLVEYLVVERNVSGCRIIEVGCGKGNFLRKMVERGNNIGWGYDPSYRGPDRDLSGKIHFRKSLYDLSQCKPQADVMICRHVIEHVEKPTELLSAIREGLIEGNGARIFIETPSLEWIFQNGSIIDFHYEHCSYFTKASLAYALGETSLRVEKMKRLFGGQYLWAEAVPVPGVRKIRRVRKRDLHNPLARKVALTEREMMQRWNKKLQKYSIEGGVALWGAGAKGVTFANMMDPERRWIQCVMDLNPDKQGKYLPGTGHIIESHRHLKNYGVKSAILPNPRYKEENLRLLREEQLPIKLVDLFPNGKA